MFGKGLLSRTTAAALLLANSDISISGSKPESLPSENPPPIHAAQLKDFSFGDNKILSSLRRKEGLLIAESSPKEVPTGVEAIFNSRNLDEAIKMAWKIAGNSQSIELETLSKVNKKILDLAISFAEEQGIVIPEDVKENPTYIKKVSGFNKLLLEKGMLFYAGINFHPNEMASLHSIGIFNVREEERAHFPGINLHQLALPSIDMPTYSIVGNVTSPEALANMRNLSGTFIAGDGDLGLMLINKDNLLLDAQIWGISPEAMRECATMNEGFHAILAASFPNKTALQNATLACKLMTEEGPLDLVVTFLQVEEALSDLFTLCNTESNSQLFLNCLAASDDRYQFSRFICKEYGREFARTHNSPELTALLEFFYGLSQANPTEKSLPLIQEKVRCFSALLEKNRWSSEFNAGLIARYNGVAGGAFMAFAPYLE